MSLELARGLLGALILRPRLLDESCGGVAVRDLDFPAGRLRETFTAITGLWEESRPAEIDLIVLGERIGGDGAVTFIASLMDGSIKLDEPTFRGRITALRKRTLTSRVLAKIESQAKSGELDLAEIQPELEEYARLEGKAFDPLSVLLTGSELQALDIRVDYIVDKLIPERSLTLLHSRGGLGKTFLALGMGKAINAGTSFLGLETKKRPVLYIDFENPLPLLVDRVRKLDILDVNFWHLSAPVRPPKLDGRDWALYKSFPSGTFMIFDTLRAAHDGDENSSQDAGLVMSRLKEIRELGHDILLLHHTTKADDRRYKGSSAFSDMADHTLDFHRVRRGTFEEIDDNNHDPDAIFSLGTGEKTRFAPMHLYLTFDPIAGGFTVADDPDKETFIVLADYIAGPGSGNNQSAIISWARREGIGPRMRGSFVALLNRGERAGWWSSHKGFRGARFYEPSI